MFNRINLISFIQKFLLSSTCKKSQKSINNPAIMKDKAIIKSEQKELNIHPVHYLTIPSYERATFGMGCFWGAESLYGATYGVLRTCVGYAGGTTNSPTYRNIGDHTEVLEIDYDPTKITYKKLLNIFWNNHEYGLCAAIKRQYMSLILYHNDEQKKIATESKIEEQERRKPEIIKTAIQEASTFYPAEDYHQKYRLQGHKELCKSLDLDINSELLRNSYVATKLNGFIAGLGGDATFLKEADNMGLTPSQKDYIRYYIEKNEGQGLYC